MTQILLLSVCLHFSIRRGDVTATSQNRLLSENISHPERVASWLLEKEKNNSKSIFIDGLLTYSFDMVAM